MIILVIVVNIVLIEIGSWVLLHVFISDEVILYDKQEKEGYLFNDLVIHPYLGFVHKPLRDEKGGIYTASVVDFGFGNQSLMQKRSPEKVIIGIFGGSVSSGIMNRSRNKDELKKMLKESDEFSGKEIMFLQFNVGGYKQPQQLQALSYFLAMGAQFDFVVNIDGFNEVALPFSENYPININLSYPRSWHQLVRDYKADPELMQSILVLDKLSKKHKSYQERLELSYLRNSNLVSLVWRILDSKTQIELQKQRDIFNELVSTQKDSFEVSGAQMRFQTIDEVAEEMSRIWKESSLIMHQISQERDITYIHILQPNQYYSHSKPLNQEELESAYFEGSQYGRGVELGYPLLRRDGEWLRDQGVIFYDWTMLFKDHSETLYVDICCHFNYEGYSLLQDELVKVIVDATSTAAN